MLMDYHIHTARCGHAKGEIGDYAAEAVKKGLDEIGFADHAPCHHFKNIKYSVPTNELAMKEEDLSYYKEDIRKLAAITSMPVLTGLEVDYYENDLSFFDRINASEYDYFIGSVHFLDGWGFDQIEFGIQISKQDPPEFFRKYLESIKTMAKTGLFDIAGHFDLPKKVGIMPPREMEEEFRETLKIIKDSGMAVELNTSGLYKGQKTGYYPESWILEICREFDMPMTLGSDAHTPEQVGRDLNQAGQTLLSLGFTSLAKFRKHEIELVPLL